MEAAFHEDGDAVGEQVAVFLVILAKEFDLVGARIVADFKNPPTIAIFADPVDGFGYHAAHLNGWFVLLVWELIDGTGHEVFDLHAVIIQRVAGDEDARYLFFPIQFFQERPVLHLWQRRFRQHH